MYACVCHGSLSTICGHWGRKRINFALSAPLPLLSINYLFHLFKGLTSLPCLLLKNVILFIFILVTIFLSFATFPFLSFVPLSLHFIILSILFWISCSLPCILLFLILDYFCIFLFILIGSIFISSIFITKWHSLPLVIR